jgi:deoxyribonuclease V
MLEEEARRRGIDIDRLKREQLKLSKKVEKKDYMDFSALQTVAGIAEQIDEKTKEIVVGMVVLAVEHEDGIKFEEIEAKIHRGKLQFPYIPGFRAYRELAHFVSCYEKLEHRPDVIFIKAHGIDHPRGLGLSSHFGIATDSCVIAISNEPLQGAEIKGEEIYYNGQLVAKQVKLVDFANPIIVSIGNKISLNTAVELTKKFSLGKYKYPYPLVAASKYVKKVARELKS